MTTDPDHWQPPEARELVQKRAQLTARQHTLAERESEAAALRAGLDAFEVRYEQALGRRLAERDALEATVRDAGTSAGAGGRTPMAGIDEADIDGQVQAPAAGDDSDPVDRAQALPDRATRLQQLYRAVAKRVHPDLAPEPMQRDRRGALMREANRAYQAGDTRQLRAIARSWDASPEAVAGEGPGAELVRLIRTLAQIDEHLEAIEAERARLLDSDLARLKAEVDAAAAGGRDLLAEIAMQVDAEIAALRHQARRERAPERRPSPPGPAPRPEGQAAPAVRELRFPSDRPLGVLYGRARGASPAEPWQPLGEAFGTIAVPSDLSVRLDVAPAARDLAALAALAPSDLQMLVLRDVAIADAQLTHLQALIGLRGLILDGAPVGDAGLAHLRRLTRLETLSLARTRIGDAGLAHLSGHRTLEVLILSQTHVGDTGLAHLHDVTGLRTLGLDDTAVRGTGLRHLQRLGRLSWLSLARSPMVDDALVHLWQLTELQGLNLAGTAVTDAGLRHLWRLTGLRRLNLDGTPIGDPGLVHVQALEGLRRLWLSGTAVTDAGLGQLGPLTGIEELSLAHTRVGDAAVPHLQRLASLTLLDISHTRISPAGRAALGGALPACTLVV